mmetsp:Transcript_30967/g.50096  ORF Transcript_30967/g.50096 Transcript_30967/m.50096 type:complete len:319 (-) Transcript_30967:72-1028(-)
MASVRIETSNEVGDSKTTKSELPAYLEKRAKPDLHISTGSVLVQKTVPVVHCHVLSVHWRKSRDATKNRDVYLMVSIGSKTESTGSAEPSSRKEFCINENVSFDYDWSDNTKMLFHVINCSDETLIATALLDLSTTIPSQCDTYRKIALQRPPLVPAKGSKRWGVLSTSVKRSFDKLKNLGREGRKDSDACAHLRLRVWIDSSDCEPGKQVAQRPPPSPAMRTGWFGMDDLIDDAVDDFELDLDEHINISSPYAPRTPHGHSKVTGRVKTQPSPRNVAAPSRGPMPYPTTRAELFAALSEARIIAEHTAMANIATAAG